MRCVALWLMIGCHGAGIDLEVQAGTTGADHVELFLGAQPCADPDCDGIEYLTTTYKGDVDYLDNSQVFTACVDPSSHTAEFRIEPGTTDNFVYTLIAVGSKTGATDCAAPTPSQEIVGTTELENLDPSTRDVERVTLEANDVAGHAVTLWRETEDPTAACVALQTAADPTKYHVIVPSDDPDCDDARGSMECPGGRDIYQDREVPETLADIHCVTPSTDAAACRLGGGCVDGAPSTCLPSSYCVPDSLCSAMCVTPSVDCFDTMATARIACSVTVGLPDNNQSQPCSNNVPGPPLDLSSLGNSLTCDKISFLALPDSKLDDFRSSAVFDDATWSVTAMMPPCVFSLGMMGNVVADATGTYPTDHAVIQLTRSSSPLHMLLPVDFDYVADPANCVGVGVMSCEFEGSTDHVWTCGP